MATACRNQERLVAKCGEKSVTWACLESEAHKMGQCRGWGRGQGGRMVSSLWNCSPEGALPSGPGDLGGTPSGDQEQLVGDMGLEGRRATQVSISS